MTDRNERRPVSADKTVRDIHRATRRKFLAEEKIRIVLEGLRGEETIAELCRKECINQKLYDRWSKDFLEAHKKWLAGGAVREATSVKHVSTATYGYHNRNSINQMRYFCLASP